jgi:cation:H+ antiporter
MYYLIFVASAAAVVYAGMKLSANGDVIAEKSGLGQSFVGLTLVAASTSLPEIISSVGAVTIVDNPDLAFGNAYGSNMFNMFIIFILDALFRRGSVFTQVSPSNVTTGVFAIILTLISGFGYFINMPVMGWVNSTSIIIMAGYVIAMYTAFKLKDTAGAKEEDGNNGETQDKPLSCAVLGFFASAFIITAAGLLMSKSADFIALDTGLGGSFVGNFLLALVTSLPEMAFCIAAVKVGSVNMAIGNLVGSNVFNMTVIPVCDLFYTKGDVFAAVSSVNSVSVLFTSIAVGFVLLGIEIDKQLKSRAGRISYASWSIAALYCMNIAYVYISSQ